MPSYLESIRFIGNFLSVRVYVFIYLGINSYQLQLNLTNRPILGY